ncbi:haloacid dehalogenase-like hydrolase [Salisediminibacterium halotolerans]|uniref:DUF7916 family protein n=1 Tax=Salisediminibacterium halotolerans TaxID=517425 RepID=UPI000EAB6BA4|nr:haloacid dehalogenase-like hydrolase [Salisediminibacterium halotolerans]RLJ75760.1 hypothetical protein BCL39_1278 [Actinophytocola xinjiangensis]RPE89614.1 hypothetical protein EDD67_0391 [Salisediminibacterium halotolerans]TWG36373.1 hypothetical protein BCL52_1275 [Salisediminibacterium halotolerans]GEL09243.1 hypothetical protein SHA02_26590 [Salisediminibacterium halotolerans]
MKRILDCAASDFAKMKPRELKESIRAAEGRTVLAETIAGAPPLVNHTTNSEIAKAYGADMNILNMYDVFHPSIAGIDELLEAHGETNPIRLLKKLTGIPVGINLEPVDVDARPLEELEHLPVGRTAADETVDKAVADGIDMICLTGNPKTGVTNDEIARAIERIRARHGDNVFIIAGKMHSAGAAGEAGAGIITPDDTARFAEAGADVLLLPAPGTVPGITVDTVRPLIDAAHRAGLLTMAAIGTSQEGAAADTVRDIALMNKMAGFDIHHIGDAGHTGIAVPENIESLSVAVRGRRHTLARMAASALR